MYVVHFKTPFALAKREMYLEQSQHHYNTRKSIAKSFGVTEYEIPTNRVDSLALGEPEGHSQKSPVLPCSDPMADYDAKS